MYMYTLHFLRASSPRDRRRGFGQGLDSYRPHWSSHFSQGSARSDAVVVGLFLLFSRSQTVSTSGRVIVRSVRIVRAMPLSRSCLCVEIKFPATHAIDMMLISTQGIACCSTSTW